MSIRSDPTETLRERAEQVVGLCDPDCEGRCRVCPAELVRDLLAALEAASQRADTAEQERDLAVTSMRRNQELALTASERADAAVHALETLRQERDAARLNYFNTSDRLLQCQDELAKRDEVTVGLNGQGQILGVWLDDAAAAIETDYRVRCKVQPAPPRLDGSGRQEEAEDAPDSTLASKMGVDRVHGGHGGQP